MLEFLIAGGGIGGAVAAHLLARQGRKVLVLERESSPRHVVRPEVLWPTTVRTLEPMLAGVDQREWRLPIQGLRAFRGDRALFEIDQTAFEKARVVPYSSDPNATRTGLLTSTGFEVRRGTELVDLLWQGDRVRGARVRDIATGAVSEIESEWVVGDDGGNSLVRRECKIAIQIRKVSIQLACFEFAWPAGLPTAVPHVVLNPAGSSRGVVAMGGIPLPRGRGIALLLLRWPQAENSTAIQTALRQFNELNSPLAGVMGERRFPEDFIQFRPQFGHASSYGMPGAVLMGDAAHPVTPAGGQGANMAIADAVALAQCVQESPADLVKTYESHRRKANEASVSISRTAAWGFRSPAWLFDFVMPPLASWFGRHPNWILQRFARSFVEVPML